MLCLWRAAAGMARAGLDLILKTQVYVSLYLYTSDLYTVLVTFPVTPHSRPSHYTPGLPVPRRAGLPLETTVGVRRAPPAQRLGFSRS